MEDISKNTIAVLLILVVLVSVIGTWVVLSTLIGFEPQTDTPKTTTFGTVELNVNQLEQQSSTTMSGNVKLTVLRPGEKEE